MCMITSVITRDCPMCNRTTVMKLNADRKQEYDRYVVYGGHTRIQDALPDFNAFEREFIKTGYCPECQEKLFGVKAPNSDEFYNKNDLAPDFWDQVMKELDKGGHVPAKFIKTEKFENFNVNEKVTVLEAFDLWDDCVISSDGTIVCA